MCSLEEDGPFVDILATHDVSEHLGLLQKSARFHASALAKKFDSIAAGLERAADNAVPLTLLDGYAAARCMDGSPAGLYFRPASASANATRWIVHLQGGAECDTLDACTEKTHSALGSSKYWLPEAKMGNFLLDDNNPYFGSWNAVVLPYCSGDMWLGQQAAPNTSMPGIQFSGHRIIEAAIQYLRSALALEAADTLILSGDSIGGAAVFSHLDFVREQLGAATRVVGVPFGVVLFPQSEGDLWYTGKDPPPGPVMAKLSPSAVESLYHLYSAFVPARCAAQLPAAPWLCIYGNIAYNTLESHIFVMQAQTDAVEMMIHDGLPASVWTPCDYGHCPVDVLSFMLTWKNALFKAMRRMIRNPTTGLYLPACFMHDAFGPKQPLISGFSAIEAFTSWFFHGDVPSKLIDHCQGLMCNPTCPKGPDIPNPLLGWP